MFLILFYIANYFEIAIQNDINVCELTILLKYALLSLEIFLRGVFSQLFQLFLAEFLKKWYCL